MQSLTAPLHGLVAGLAVWPTGSRALVAWRRAAGPQLPPVSTASGSRQLVPAPDPFAPPLSPGRTNPSTLYCAVLHRSDAGYFQYVLVAPQYAVDAACRPRRPFPPATARAPASAAGVDGAEGEGGAQGAGREPDGEDDEGREPDGEDGEEDEEEAAAGAPGASAQPDQRGAGAGDSAGGEAGERLVQLAVVVRGLGVTSNLGSP